jgi:hypothetical protein
MSAPNDRCPKAILLGMDQIDTQLLVAGQGIKVAYLVRIRINALLKFCVMRERKELWHLFCRHRKSDVQ